MIIFLTLQMLSPTDTALAATSYLLDRTVVSTLLGGGGGSSLLRHMTSYRYLRWEGHLVVMVMALVCQSLLKSYHLTRRK